MRHISLLVFAITILVCPALRSVSADERWHGDNHGFYGHDLDRWRGGGWYNGFHDGRNGWWWVVDGVWYFYPAPVYPYPDPYTPPTVVMTQPSVATTAVPQTVYYYCADPAGYYPSIPQCAGGWQRVVPATGSSPQPAANPSIPQTNGGPISSMGSGRSLDEAQLNIFVARFQNIDLSDPHARTKLKDLDKKVEDFRQSLYKNEENVMDILKNAEDLKKRIEQQLKDLAQNKN